MVAQLNRNYGEQRQKFQEQVVQLQEEVVKIRNDLARLKNTISAEQVATDKDLAVVRSRLSKAEQALAVTMETQELVKYQVADSDKTQKNAEHDRQLRNEERDETTKRLEDTRALVEKTKGENSELMDQLKGLRDEFTKVLADNKRLLERAGRVRRTAGAAR
jgi:DNA repair exonuclease SbcCD ATPase subunit